MKSPAHLAIAGALGCIARTTGLALALRNARRYLHAAAEIYDKPEYLGWVETADEMGHVLAMAALSSTHLFARGAASIQPAPFQSFLKPIASCLPANDAAKIEAELGRAVLASASTLTTISPVLAEGFTRVLRAGTRQTSTKAEWDQLAQDFPGTPEAIKERMGKIRHPHVKKFLAQLLSSHAIAVRSPDDLAPRTAPIRSPAAGQVAALFQQSTPENAWALEHDSSDKEVPRKFEASFLGWKREAARRAGYRNRFGVNGQWDRQTPAELTHVGKAIRKALVPGGKSSAFAYLAQIVVNSSLPTKLAIRIPIGRSTDLFMEDDLRAIGWCLLSMLNRKGAKPVDASQVPESMFVLIPQSEEAMIVGAELRALHPGARSIIELLIGTSEKRAVKRFLSKYSKWLRDLGAGWLHRICDARLAKSFSQIYRSQAGDVVAAFLGLDFREVAQGTLHYIALPTAYLESQVALAYERIGWGKPVPLERTVEIVGSPHALSIDKFVEGMSRLASAGSEARRRMLVETDARLLVRHFKVLVHIRQLQAITLMGGRGTRINRLTWYALWGHADYAMLGDKFTHRYSQERLIPAFAQLSDVLDGYVEDIEAFKAAAQKLRIDTVDHRGRPFDERRASRPAFITVGLARSGNRLILTRQLTKRRHLTFLAKRFLGGPLNVGRHTLLSAAVLEGIDSWVIKALSGHSHGLAEPFADGGAVAPRHALHLLAGALAWILRELPLTQRSRKTEPRYVLPMSALIGRRPSESRASQSRVLPAFCDIHSILALRVVDHVAQVLLAGRGPARADAELFLSAMVLSWTGLADIRCWWEGDPFRLVGGAVPVAAWRRHDGGQEIIRPLEGPTAIALLRFQRDTGGSLPPWDATCRSVAAWLRANVPGVNWPETDEEVVAVLDALVQRTMRNEVPPFILTAASSRVAAATANRSSVLRLAADPRGSVDDRERPVLVAPLVMDLHRSNTGPSPLKEVMTLIHHFGRPDLPLGEEQKRWKDLSEKVRAMDCRSDARARAVSQWIEREALLQLADSRSDDRGHIEPSDTDPIQVRTASDYISLISQALERSPPFAPMERWHEEWFDFLDLLVVTAQAKSDKKRRQVVERRFIAARRFLRSLTQCGYPIPASLLQPSVAFMSDDRRRAAASTLLLESDQTRIRERLSVHYRDAPVLDVLAPLYADLRFETRPRSTECHVLPIRSLSPFDDLVFSTGGWSHMKSENARRLVPLRAKTAAQIREAVALVTAAEPSAPGIFLLHSEDDWSVIAELARTFTAFLREETGEPDALPHAARAVGALDELLGSWEGSLRALLKGSLTAEQCLAFCHRVQASGVQHVVQATVRIGHGHPLTLLTYYFAVWALLLSVWARAWRARYEGPESLLERHASDVLPALHRAQERARGIGATFDAWSWTLVHVGAEVGLKPLAVDSSSDEEWTETPLPPPSGAPDESAKVLYVAARLADFDPKPAAYAFSLTNTLAAELESKLEAAYGKELRLRVDLPNYGRGNDALIRRLRTPQAKVLAERFLAMAITEIDHGMAALGSGATSPTRPIGIEALSEQLRALACALPSDFALLVQARAKYYSGQALARLATLAPRTRVGKEVRRLGIQPRVSVVDSKNEDNRVRHGRFTHYVRCLLASVQLLRLG